MNNSRYSVFSFIHPHAGALGGRSVPALPARHGPDHGIQDGGREALCRDVIAGAGAAEGPPQQNADLQDLQPGLVGALYSVRFLLIPL